MILVALAWAQHSTTFKANNVITYKTYFPFA
jgi:hypothetical protein